MISGSREAKDQKRQAICPSHTARVCVLLATFSRLPHLWNGAGSYMEAKLVHTYILKGSIHGQVDTDLMYSQLFKKLTTKYACVPSCKCAYSLRCRSLSGPEEPRNMRPHPRQAPARSFPEQSVARPASLDSTRDQWLPAALGHRLDLLQRL